MALKINFPFPLFSPPVLSPSPRGPSEVRFSRWNNANAERFNQRRREQEEIEADLRRVRRFDSAARISLTQDATAAHGCESAVKSVGTPSAPSAPSIPGKKSKYSKPLRAPKIKNKPQVPERLPQVNSSPEVRVSEEGVSYAIDGAPFEFKYSYTETPKVKPVKLREPYAPFGPATLGRPWTGNPPLPPSKKMLKEFDSFELPPPGKKGVKPVQKPGPFLPGSGPRYVKTREEILGEPLTKEEIKELIDGCIRSRRQLHMGRDGFTHNMLDNIHAHWKRRRVCKIKCLGVCTVDMDNVCQQLEEKTGGKVIHRTGGVVFLFRGRNYNYKTRPRFPLMLWRPVTPVYPRLVKRVPEGLTLEEATEMRRKGRELMPICKLAKNGVYIDLIKNVREAFEVCELVRINCQGVKGSDYRKIGAKLKDLVPCVLLSFANEHILMWRGPNWKSSLPTAESEDGSLNGSEANPGFSSMDSMDRNGEPREDRLVDTLSSIPTNTDDVTLGCVSNKKHVAAVPDYVNGGESSSDKAYSVSINSELEGKTNIAEESTELINPHVEGFPEAEITGSDMATSFAVSRTEPEGVAEAPDGSEPSQELTKAPKTGPRCLEGVLLLMKQAVETGSALVLEEADLDPDVIFKRAADFARSAPPGPVFGQNRRKQAAGETEKQEPKAPNLEMRNENVEGLERSGKERPTRERRDAKPIGDFLNTDFRDDAPQGSLGVDELAKLLS